MADKDFRVKNGLIVGENAVVNGEVLANTVQLTGGTGDQGTVSWNSDEQTLDLVQDNTTLQVGQEVVYNVRNNSGSTILNGTPVMSTGTLGNSGRITIAPMDGTDPANAKFFLGIATEDIVNDTDGKVTHFGKVRGVDLSAYSEGDVLWISTTTAGQLTATEPSVGIKVPVAFVINNSAQVGTMMVRAERSLRIEDIDDIQISNVADGEVLTYDATSQSWQNQSIAETDTLDSITSRGATTTNDITVGNLTSTGIDDNASSTALTLDSSGNVGIGNSTPDVTLSVGSNDANGDGTVGIGFWNLSDSVTASGMFPIRGGRQLFVGAGLKSSDTTSTSFEYTANYYSGIYFSNNPNSLLRSIRFFVGFGGTLGTDTTSPTEAMRINSSGNVGIGTDTPSEKLHVTGNILASGDITAFSDERLKSDIETLDGSKVLEMRGVSFVKDGKAGSGVIAQELQKVAPELVNESGEYLSVAYGNLVGYLIESIKELNIRVEELENGAS